MEFIEAEPLPVVCRECSEAECYECDFAMARWKLSDADEAELMNRLRQQGAERLLQKQKSGQPKAFSADLKSVQKSL